MNYFPDLRELTICLLCSVINCSRQLNRSSVFIYLFTVTDCNFEAKLWDRTCKMEVFLWYTNCSCFHVWKVLALWSSFWWGLIKEFSFILLSEKRLSLLRWILKIYWTLFSFFMSFLISIILRVACELEYLFIAIISDTKQRRISTYCFCFMFVLQ